MPSRRLFLLTILIYLATSTTALAWNKPGHMLTGAIAYYELKAKDPAALAKVINFLKQNPYYQHEWLPRIENFAESDADRHDLYLFMYAARWPDDIRGIPSLHCDQCHYINYPFKPDNQPAGLVVKPPADENILTKYSEANSTLQSSTASAVAKSRALCWVFHLIGDVHQPLHTSTLFTVVFPDGDRGGTRFYIAEAENERSICTLSGMDSSCHHKNLGQCETEPEACLTETTCSVRTSVNSRRQHLRGGPRRAWLLQKRTDT